MLPTPPFWSCQTAASSMSIREPLLFSSPLGPEERLPAASWPVAVVGLRTNRMGRNGRFFSRRRNCSAAATSSRREAISGRLFTAIGTRPFGRLVAGDERDLQERRLDRLQQRGRVEQQDLRQLGAGDPPVADGDLLGLPQASGARSATG